MIDKGLGKSVYMVWPSYSAEDPVLFPSGSNMTYSMDEAYNMLIELSKINSSAYIAIHRESNDGSEIGFFDEYIDDIPMEALETRIADDENDICFCKKLLLDKYKNASYNDVNLYMLCKYFVTLGWDVSATFYLKGRYYVSAWKKKHSVLIPLVRSEQFASDIDVVFKVIAENTDASKSDALCEYLAWQNSEIDKERKD